MAVTPVELMEAAATISPGHPIPHVLDFTEGRVLYCTRAAYNERTERAVTVPALAFTWTLVEGVKSREIMRTDAERLLSGEDLPAPTEAEDDALLASIAANTVVRRGKRR